MHLKDPRQSPFAYTPRPCSRTALLWLCATALLAQQPTTIRVPVRLVSVPTLVLGPDGRVLTGLQAGDFRLFDDERPRPFTLDTSVSPVSVVIAVQANPDIRAYLPFIARVGNALDALLVGASGESAAIVYGDEVTVAKPFDSGDLRQRFARSSPRQARARDRRRGARPALLRQRPATRIACCSSSGSPWITAASTAPDLRREAERDSVTIHALALPEIARPLSRIRSRCAVSRRATYWSAADSKPGSTSPA